MSAQLPFPSTQCFPLFPTAFSPPSTTSHPPPRQSHKKAKTSKKREDSHTLPPPLPPNKSINLLPPSIQSRTLNLAFRNSEKQYLRFLGQTKCDELFDDVAYILYRDAETEVVGSAEEEDVCVRTGGGGGNWGGG